MRNLFFQMNRIKQTQNISKFIFNNKCFRYLKLPLNLHIHMLGSQMNFFSILKSTFCLLVSCERICYYYLQLYYLVRLFYMKLTYNHRIRNFPQLWVNFCHDHLEANFVRSLKPMASLLLLDYVCFSCNIFLLHRPFLLDTFQNRNDRKPFCEFVPRSVRDPITDFDETCYGRPTLYIIAKPIFQISVFHFKDDKHL